ncbi:hypothetical protein FGK63_07045 [Ruegeria sediminis]|uniref:Uncharacterized protein n=1 Tax=Ruegeria sediminis TaxID=2583820 RepID=A0ABY2X1R3_9RHOB|nr:hypothetical protein [Ruegeria sediminis]TMV08869.1 hypothetical protein FGK63_07045 [Ruegeria sediminis]
MSNCVNCVDPPGGSACCDPGQTPMCLVLDGQAQSVCMTLSPEVTADPARISAALKSAVLSLAGSDYTEDLERHFTLAGPLVHYFSSDGRIRMTARNPVTDAGAQTGEGDT